MKNLSLFFGLAILLSLSACRFFSGKSAEEVKREAEIKSLYGGVAIRPYAGKTIFSFIGKPGSGKGTLAEQSFRALRFKKFSTGDLLRSEIASGSERGKAIEATVAEGQLVSDDMITAMVDAWLEREGKEAENIVLDGYPRTEKQAEMLLGLLKQKYTDVTFRVILLDLSDTGVMERLANRLVCDNKQCQAIFNRTRFDLICPVCGSNLVPRSDDRPSIVQDRLVVYEKYTNPLMLFYKAAGFPIEVISVTGLNPEEVYYEFRKFLPEEK